MLNKICFRLFLGGLLSLLSAVSLAQMPELAELPELAQPSTATGAPTTAAFFGGVSADEGLTFADRFDFDQPVDISLAVRVETAHVNTVGNVYVVIVLGEQFFMAVEGGLFAVWDQSLETLQALMPAHTLQSTQEFKIIDSLALGPAGAGGATLNIFVAYDTVAAPGELYFSGLPLSFAIETQAVAANSVTLFNEAISGPIIQSNCIVCHVSGGAATGSGLIYERSSQPDYQQSNYDQIANYLQTRFGAKNVLINSPQGIAHGGGVRLAPGSAALQNWIAFIEALESDLGL